MKSTSKLAYYRNGLFMGFLSDLVSITDTFDLKGLQLEGVMASIKNNVAALKEVYIIPKKNGNTEKLEQLDLRRDMAILGVQGVAEVYLKHYDADFVSAAKAILIAIYKYDKRIDRLNYLLESENIRNLVKEFETDRELINALTKLSLSDWAAELKAANNAFNAVFLLRNDELAEQPDQNLTELRLPAIENFKNLEELLFAYNKINPKTDYEKIINKLDELKQKYDALLRSGNTPKVDNTPPTPPTQ